MCGLEGGASIGTSRLRQFLPMPFVLMTLVLAFACSGEEKNSGNAKSAILVIGDGMGASHRGAIRLATVGTEGSLEMDSLPYSGLSHTLSVDPEEQVTDSAAAGTAIASGVKTYNGAVGVNAEGEQVATLLELAKRDGKSVGLVTTSTVTDATPAAFAAHVENRNAQSEIARQYLEETKPDVILGGGEDYWYPEGVTGNYPDGPSEEGSRGSKGNLVEKAERLGYETVANNEELEESEGNRILGLFANEAMYQARPESQGDSYDPVVPLPEMTRKAIEMLSRDEQGFFLLVEEEAIDSMSHENNAELMLEAGQQLDEAVGVAKDYAENNPNTLLVVGADHEAGGMSIEDVRQAAGEGSFDPHEDGPFRVAGSESNFSVDWTTDEHTATDVPITAMGPRAELFSGTYEDTHLYDALREALLQEG